MAVNVGPDGKITPFRCSPCECGGHDDCSICNPPTVLTEAARIVAGPRQAAYGHPLDNHACTAAMWTAYFARCGLLKDDAEITPRQVCIANVLQKASRDANAPSRDNLTDIAGYVANAELVE